MRFGLTILPEIPWAEAAPRWRAAEELGFDHAWTYDHLVWGGLPESPWFGTTPTLTAAAHGHLDRSASARFVSSPNFRHPVTFGRDVQSLDDISGGRFLLGVGHRRSTSTRGSSAAPTLSVQERVDRFQEFVDLLRAAARRGPRRPATALVLGRTTRARCRRCATYRWSWPATGPGPCGSPRAAATPGSPPAARAETVDDWFAGVGGVGPRARRGADRRRARAGRGSTATSTSTPRRASRWRAPELFAEHGRARRRARLHRRHHPLAPARLPLRRRRGHPGVRRLRRDPLPSAPDPSAPLRRPVADGGCWVGDPSQMATRCCLRP